MAKNDKQWSSATPGLLIILLDQSGSMTEPYEGTSRTKFATSAVNKVIDNIIQKNFDGDAPRYTVKEVKPKYSLKPGMKIYT